MTIVTLAILAVLVLCCGFALMFLQRDTNFQSLGFLLFMYAGTFLLVSLGLFIRKTEHENKVLVEVTL